MRKPDDAVSIHKATSEFEAMSIREMLDASGIPVMVRSRVDPGYGVATMAGGQAGIVADILVRPEHEAAARALLAGFLASLEQGTEEPGDEP